jgi:hypothetical protein
LLALYPIGRIQSQRSFGIVSEFIQNKSATYWD